MPRGKKLNDNEIGKILAYDENGKSHDTIAALINRSQTVVSNFLRNPNVYGNRKFKGPPKINSPTAIRALRRTAKQNKGMTSMELASISGIKGSKSTVCRILKNDLSLKNKHAIKLLPLKACHIEARLNYAQENIRMNFENGVIFSDEKRFSFTGPDNYYKAWLGKSDKYTTYKIPNYGGVHIWAAFIGDHIIGPYVLKSKDVFNTKRLKLFNVITILFIFLGIKKYFQNCYCHICRFWKYHGHYFYKIMPNHTFPMK